MLRIQHNMEFTVCLETDKQLGRFTMPQLLLSSHNNIQALPKLMVLEPLRKLSFIRDSQSQVQGQSPVGLSELFQSVPGLMAACLVTFSQLCLTNGRMPHFGEELWLLQTSTVLACQLYRTWGLALNALTGCFTLEGGVWLTVRSLPSSIHAIDIPWLL